MDRSQLFEIPAARLRARRAGVFGALEEGIMLLPSAPEQFSSRDSDREYRPDSELFYLTGVVEPGAVAAFVGGEEPRWILFVAPRDAEAELWSGPRLGKEGASERFGPDETHGVDDLERVLADLLSASREIYYRFGSCGRIDRVVRSALARARTRGPRTGTGPRSLIDPGEILDEMRLRKDPHEIARMRAAAALTLEGHRAARRAVAPRVGEWTVRAELEAAFLRGGGAPGFGTIVGSGPNACVLHYRASDRVMEDGDLILVDAGAELGLYHGDVTRTYPVSGRFSGPQRAIYELVEVARDAAVGEVRPGVPVSAVHECAVRVIVEGLVDLGLLHGNPEDLVDRGAYKAFYPHQTSHWLGLDVHDPGDYARGGTSRVLEEGMVLTVEPGVYVRPGADDAPESYRGIGVRIEDDVLVTGHGHEVLTAALPTAVDRIEDAMASGDGVTTAGAGKKTTERVRQRQGTR